MIDIRQSTMPNVLAIVKICFPDNWGVPTNFWKVQFDQKTVLPRYIAKGDISRLNAYIAKGDISRLNAYIAKGDISRLNAYIAKGDISRLIFSHIAK